MIEPTLTYSQAEARHLVNILLDYTRRSDALWETQNVVDGTTVTTIALLEKATVAATALPIHPAEPTHS